MAESMRPVGVRFPGYVLAELRERSDPDLGIGEVVRHLVELALAGRPELWGVTEVAAELGTTTSNVGKFRGLPEPLYSPDHPNPRYRLKAGRLWDAAEVRTYADDRRAG